MKTLTAILALLAVSTTSGIAQTNHGMDHSNMPMSSEQMEGAVHAKALVNSIGDETANVSHDPIPEIGWPAMTMDLQLLENAQMMGEISAGDEVTLMLVKSDDGMYAIGAIMKN
ncbi:MULTISPECIES: copper-binding protein [Ruegeria]|jgi:Cu(I)/Ag(I) efflux system protein CusF|uniref:Cation transporter n=1 Tax=Ruegeria atlantica TaxID=81569 RepID=A0AA91C0R3_9RHOB|nr:MULTISPECIES: copper-binding protein [Ruegeria]NOC47392.1 cation transporter [Ruegeria sp. HKCCD7559]NOD49590.1 cation transporter [Ruegeria sp. HKCCD5849]NOD54056.1 cation transporter [Ruegeria sp. HKCCD5851]NOD69918.1 cation transporter [Ruegeria sp. HKCCD7303]NOE20441.1 cation transporter [Ruegeria atlantica]